MSIKDQSATQHIRDAVAAGVAAGKACELHRVLPQLVTIHRDLAAARRNASLPTEFNTLGSDLHSVQCKIEDLVTSMGGGRYLDGIGWVKQ